MANLVDAVGELRDRAFGRERAVGEERNGDQRCQNEPRDHRDPPSEMKCTMSLESASPEGRYKYIMWPPE